MRSSLSRFPAAALLVLLATSSITHADDDAQARIESAVKLAIEPVMAKYTIPGVAVGVVVAGKPHFFTYGVASRQTGQPVTRYTLFEVGSVTKTFTATLATYAQVSGKLSLSDKTSQYLPSLKGHPFGEVSLISLGTHTPGGLPLQVPDSVQSNDQLLRYFEQWQPVYAPGTHRTYANPSSGALGLIAATAMGEDFTKLMESRLFSELGLNDTYINVPKTKSEHYAQGYTKEEAPIRMKTGVLSSEAYGIKTTVTDLTRFMQANMKLITLDPTLQQAITNTHTGYFKVGGMTQDLMWEQYPYPVQLQTLLEGNSSNVILNATPVTEITPPQKPQADVWINKTGATTGFGAYVAFIPQRQLGIVILANKNYPNEDRVRVAYQVLKSLADNKL